MTCPRIGTVLCPVDFSEPSRTALRYGAMVAAESGANLSLLTVNDPLLAEAADMINGSGSLDAEAIAETRRFFDDTFSGRVPDVRAEFAVATGRSEIEILRLATEGAVGLIVMSSRGATGIRKLFLGSITERVLRAANVPVLVTEPDDPGPQTPDDARELVRRILVPVDLTGAMDHQMRVAHLLAAFFGVSRLLVAHVVEPVRAVVPGHVHAANVDSERRDRAERRLRGLAAAFPPPATPMESLVVFGDPAEEIAKIASDRRSGLIVMALHGSAESPPRMGSVTYRVLCITKGLVLAVPPMPPPCDAINRAVEHFSGASHI
jgi:nucleotide-binding universal stress UspA family protein